MKKTIWYNLTGAVIVLTLFGLCNWESGYRAKQQTILGYYHFAHKNKHLSLDDRYAVQMGALYTFFRYVRENTPEDAVIYLPAAWSFFNNAQSDFFYSCHMGTKLWATRFLYPRKVVSAAEYELGKPFKPLTHVMLVSKDGKNILPYEIGDTDYVVLPIHKSNQP